MEYFTAAEDTMQKLVEEASDVVSVRTVSTEWPPEHKAVLLQFLSDLIDLQHRMSEL